MFILFDSSDIFCCSAFNSPFSLVFSLVSSDAFDLACCIANLHSSILCSSPPSLLIIRISPLELFLNDVITSDCCEITSSLVYNCFLTNVHSEENRFSCCIITCSFFSISLYTVISSSFMSPWIVFMDCFYGLFLWIVFMDCFYGLFLWIVFMFLFCNMKYLLTGLLNITRKSH